MEKLESLIKNALGKDSAKSALAFMITLDIVKEIEIYSLANKVVRVIFSSLENIKGVEVRKDDEKIASYGDLTHPSMDFPLTSGYILKVYINNKINNENLKLLRYLQALLSYHIYNILELERIREKAMLDPLTGAYTRAIGEELLKKYFQGAMRGKRFSIVFVDLDDLKLINDTHGHEEGDNYLKNFVESFKSNAREEDIIIRWGGDEFILLFEGATKENTDLIMKRIASDFDGNFSYGVVAVPLELKKMQDTIKIADERMYEMKKAKRLSSS